MKIRIWSETPIDEDLKVAKVSSHPIDDRISYTSAVIFDIDGEDRHKGISIFLTGKEVALLREVIDQLPKTSIDDETMFVVRPVI